MVLTLEKHHGIAKPLGLAVNYATTSSRIKSNTSTPDFV
jgi:hypothetical protein